MPRHVRRTVAALSLAFVVALAATGSVAANFPGRNGQITFQRHDADGNWQIWVANPDLTQQRQITTGPSSNAFPAWSPDSSRIAFQSNRTDADPTDDVEIQDIFTMRPDGTDVRQVTDSLGDSEKPAWSPDGRWLLFAADRADYPRSQGIYVVRSSGSTPRRVTRLPSGSVWQELARFSPDGTRIEYTEYRLTPAEDPGEPDIEESALFVSRADGSHPRRITPWALHAADADWSPDGRRLVFAPGPASNDYIQSVMVVDADGSHLRALTRGDGVTGDGDDFRYQESFNAVWSPDGTRIMFVRASFTPADGFSMGLMTMRPDGSRQAFVSEVHGEEHQPEWGTLRPLR